jgi:hypothetical protein
MQPSVAAGWIIAFAVLFLALLRLHAVRVAIPLAEVAIVAPGAPDDDEEQMPETDRAPRRLSWLPLAVGAMAAIRLAFLVILQR